MTTTGPTPTDTTTDPTPAELTGPSPAELTGAEPTTGVVVLVDPGELLVDLNIRAAHLSRPFVASIREHGVVSPVVAVRTTDGRLRVRLGHRRTLAALDAGRATVPVYVAGVEDDDTVARVVGQITENEQRLALSTSERIGAVEQLSAFGLSAGQIAKRTKASRADVDHALHAARSDVARAAADRYDFLTLDQSAALAEFDRPVARDGTGGRDEQAITALVAAAKLGPVEFDHALTAARDHAADRAARAVAVDALATAGVAVIDRPAWQDEATPLHRLAHDGQPLTVQSHAVCPGRVAWLEPDWAWTGPGEPDEDDQNHWGRTYLPAHACADPAAHGHTDRWAATTGIPARTTAATPTDPATAAAAALAAQEAKRAERRTVIAHNKAMDAATPVRRAWLASVLGRKTAPAGSAALLAASLRSGAYRGSFGTASPDPLAVELLGLAEGTDLTAAAEQASEARALVIALAVTLAGYEVQVTRDAWRSAWPAHRAYFGWIGTHGYTLSDVETLAAGIKPKPTKTAKTTTKTRTRPTPPTATSPAEADTEHSTTDTTDADSEGTAEDGADLTATNGDAVDDGPDESGPVSADVEHPEVAA